MFHDIVLTVQKLPHHLLKAEHGLLPILTRKFRPAQLLLDHRLGRGLPSAIFGWHLQMFVGKRVRDDRPVYTWGVESVKRSCACSVHKPGRRRQIVVWRYLEEIMYIEFIEHSAPVKQLRLHRYTMTDQLGHEMLELAET